jgi:5-hydroxyisourate hydrolase
MTRITTHVLDTARGKPAAGVPVSLAVRTGEGWTEIAAAPTDADGRVADLLPDGVTRAAGIYRLRFDTGAYFEAQGVPAFHPFVDVTFTVDEGGHYHVPLLLSPWGYTTYRGS